MNVIFMGTPEFSIPTLEEIIKAGHNVIAVVTQPDKPRGRGKAVLFPPVKERALQYSIPVYQPVRAKEEAFVQKIEELKPDVIVVVAFGQILSQNILDLPKYGCINVHASLLPKYRGAAPIQWAVIDGEKVSGITTMQMDSGLDTGNILLKEEIPLADKETGGSLHDKLSVLGAALLVKTLEQIENGTIISKKQDDSKSNYAKKLDKSLGYLDFSKQAKELERLIRGLNPWPSAYTFLGKKTLKIWEADVIDREESGNTGEIINITKDAIIVKTGSGCLALKEIQLEGKKRMTVEAFLRGYIVEVGTILKSEKE